MISSPMTLRSFMLGHIRAWTAKCDVTVFVNTKGLTLTAENLVAVEVRHLRIERNISLFRDLAALVSLSIELTSGGYDAIVSVTPKAGLIGMLAGWLCRTRIRLHIFTGQVWATKAGMSRATLKFFDFLTASFATNLLVDSRSQLQFLVDERITSFEKSKLIGSGSIAGVDTQRFRLDQRARQKIRANYGIANTHTLILYLGRLTKDKGVLHLAKAFADLSSTDHSVHLLFVGSDEERMRRAIRKVAQPVENRIYFIDHTESPEKYMSAADIFCLPSHREGFGTAVIEAASVGIPTVASNIYGLTDAVLDGETGLLFSNYDVTDLRSKIETLVREPQLRRKLGLAARLRVLREFSAPKVIGRYRKYIYELLRVL